MTRDEETGCIDPYDTEERPDGWAVIDTKTRGTVVLCGLAQERLTRDVAFDLVMWLNLALPESESVCVGNIQKTYINEGPTNEG